MRLINSVTLNCHAHHQPSTVILKAVRNHQDAARNRADTCRRVTSWLDSSVKTLMKHRSARLQMTLLLLICHRIKNKFS